MIIFKCVISTLYKSINCFTAFTCHDTGANCLGYAPQHGLLVSGGKRGEVYILEVRAQKQRERIVAHNSAVKCLSIGPNEDLFATGAADGDIKV